MDWTRSKVSELDEALRGDVQNFATTVKFSNGTFGDRMGNVGLIGQPSKDAGIDENGHLFVQPVAAEGPIGDGHAAVNGGTE